MAHGAADAEHLVEKELSRLWPQARVTILEIARQNSDLVLAQDFLVRYRLDALLEIDASSLAEARAAAPARARARLNSSRYARAQWHLPPSG